MEEEAEGVLYTLQYPQHMLVELMPTLSSYSTRDSHKDQAL